MKKRLFGIFAVVTIAIVTALPLGMAHSASAQDPMLEYQAQLKRELAHSKDRFTQAQKRVESERGTLLKQLTALETELIGLRQQLAGQTRAQDEAFVSIAAMEKRLNQWQEQNRYIHNLLVRHAGHNGGDPLSVLQQELAELPSKLAPQWTPGQAIAANGAIVSGKRLDIGPLSYLLTQQELSLLQWRDTLGHELPVIALSLSQTSASHLPVDVSGSRALRIAAEEKNWWQRLELGGVWVFPIIGMGILALVMALKKAWQLRGQPKPNCALVARFMSDGQLPEGAGWQRELIREAWQRRGCGMESMADQLHQILLQFKSRQDAGMAMIAATAAVAPLMGLLGTVSGMIHTFEMMNLFGNQDSSLLAGGISEALITTELGLVVAIPALLIHAWLSRRHQGLLNQLEADAMLLNQLGDRRDE